MVAYAAALASVLTSVMSWSLAAALTSVYASALTSVPSLSGMPRHHYLACCGQVVSVSRSRCGQVVTALRACCGLIVKS